MTLFVVNSYLIRSLLVTQVLAAKGLVTSFVLIR